MRAPMMLFLLAGSLLTLGACAKEGPFNKIRSVKVRHIGSNGLQDKVFTDEEMRQLVQCLYTSREVEEAQTLRELLQTTYLIEVSDALGDRSFELYTAENLKGNKGKYYVNTCIHKIIEKAGSS